MNILKKPFFLTRFFMLILGCLLIGFGISVFKFVNLGLDPYGVLIVGLSNTFKVSYGSILPFANTIIFIMALIIHKNCLKLVGIGTLINMSIIGYIIDFFSLIYDKFIIINLPFYIKIIFTLTALIIFSIGVSLYITPNLGIAPYELISISIIKFSKDKLNFNKVRVAQDTFSLLCGLILGAGIGINTLVLGVFTGIIVGFFNNICNKYIVKNRW